jgi:alkylation response protein AidB-like acyl-CoA dehydrogenase
MDFDLTETQQLFKRSARELFAQECPPTVVREMIESGSPYSERLWTKLVEQGWTGLIFPESAGGMALGMIELAVAFEELGRALVPGAFLSTVPLAGSVLLGAAPSEQISRRLESICDGKSKATVALLEESARWEIEAVTLHAVESPDGITFNGNKLFVSDAEAADSIITTGRLGSDLILAVVQRDTPGVTIKLMPSLDVTRNLYAVSFDNVRIGVSEVISRGDAAYRVLAHALDVATIAIAAEMVGGMQWILDASVEYAKTRKQFGKPIGQFQAIQHHCANMLLMTESARSAVYYAAWVMESEPEKAPVAVSIAKAYASDSYREVGNLGIQVHGGIGFTWDENIHFYYKRAKAAELMFGDATYHRERIAKLVIDRASEPSTAASGNSA